MRFSPAWRRLVLSLHLVTSVGWVGAAVAYLGLDLMATTTSDVTLLRAAYLGMYTVTWRAIVPLAIGSWVTGVALALGTKWGLFRHYWVVISFILTTLAIVVLLVETATIDALASYAADPTVSTLELLVLPSTLPHSVGGLVVLLVVLVLNVYKPRGLTRCGLRLQPADA